MSRSAKNQKDFKVSALDDWRKSDTFACLVAPLYQFPTQNSQIYQQAIKLNVVLLGYTHLVALLNSSSKGILNLEPFWKATREIQPTTKASLYWAAITQTVLRIGNYTPSDWQVFQKDEQAVLLRIGQDGIQYWQSTIEHYRSLSKEEAISRLIQSEKIEEKIIMITRFIEKMRETPP